VGEVSRGPRRTDEDGRAIPPDGDTDAPEAQDAGEDHKFPRPVRIAILVIVPITLWTSIIILARKFF
jgi:hypothetical protein